MDPSLLQQHNITTKLSALSIEGSETPVKSFNEPLYRQPGYSTQNLNLLQLMSKPLFLNPVTVDSTFLYWSFPILALQPIFHQWIEPFIKNFCSPRFNINLTLNIPGHQFAVVKFGAAYIPGMVGEDQIYFPNPSDPTIPFRSNTPRITYNQVRAANGVFFSLCSSSKTVNLKSTIPTNYPMNPMDKTNVADNPQFGGFYINAVTPIRFGMSLTNITIRPVINLTDLALMPWNH